MLLLTSTSDLLRITTSSAADIKVHASWVDNAAGTITPGRTNTAISSATTTTVVASPGSSTQRTVKNLLVRNDHASTANTLTLLHTDGTTSINLYVVSLAAGESLVFDDSGLTRFNSAGIPLAGSNTGAAALRCR